MNRFSLIALATLAALAPFAAKADTVINLNGTIQQDGNVFYKTLSTSNLAAGTYTATFVGTGFKASDGTTAAYTAWAKYYPAGGNWEEAVAVDTTGGTFTAKYDPTYFGGGLENNYTTSGATAFGTDTHYATAALALAAESSASYTFTVGSTGTTTFYLSDSQYPAYTGYSDNSGGVSLDVKAVTPEPSSLIMLGTGVLSAAGMIKRRFNA